MALQQAQLGRRQSQRFRCIPFRQEIAGNDAGVIRAQGTADTSTQHAWQGVRPEIRLSPLIVGGGQEHGYRPGTENLPAIVGMGVAADLARAEAPAEVARLARLRDRLLDGLLAAVPGTRVTGARGEQRLPHHVSLVVSGVKADGILMELDLRGVAGSSGSACTAMSGEPSYVLRAIGCAPEAAEGSLCFTLGRWTNQTEIDLVLDILPAVVERLRRLAP